MKPLVRTPLLLAGALLLTGSPLLAAVPGTHSPPVYLELFGRLHVVLVHFPLALILVAAGFEWLSRSEDGTWTALCCLRVGALFAVLTAVSGWLFAEHSELRGAALEQAFWHRWSGIAATLFAVLAILYGARSEGRSPVYRWGLLLAGILVATTGHLGGTMTWGRGWFLDVFEPGRFSAPSGAAPQAADPLPHPGRSKLDIPDPKLRRPKPGTSGSSGPVSGPAGSSGTHPGVDYATQIQPILAANCFGCHGEKRQRARLRLDRMAAVFAAEQADWVILPGDPDHSLVIERVSLPPEHEDFMPLDGPPLLDAEIELLRRWIAEGARWDPGALLQGS